MPGDRRNIVLGSVAVKLMEKVSFVSLIIVGRRGLSGVREFFIGRVSNKVIRLARKNTVWGVT